MATDLIQLCDLGEQFPGGPSRTTLVRYMNDGVAGVKLRSVRVGGKVMCRRKWVLDFLRALNGDDTAAVEEICSVGD